jgi:alginate O-acetyltransferase complex protein AlgI
MVFSSLIFLFLFLPVTLAVYYLLKGRLRNFWIVFVSIFFYSWGAPKYIFVVLLAMGIDFLIAKWIHKAKGVSKKWVLFFGVSINVAALLYFKYFNFFIDNMNTILGYSGYSAICIAKVALPIGISFFTFHEISYLVDVYRAKKMPFRNISDYALYILFFPQLVAGPIIRFNEISEQIADYSRSVSIDDKLFGFIRFVIGLSKKVLIANVCGAYADEVFALESNFISTSTAWIGALAYTMQIYFDFSGYSDMAIGIARMLGFIFPENFNAPYISGSITEFWRRWHISLSRWIRDYLYIALGGNKVSPARMYFNLILCFLVSGFWHGAEWTFILWGAYHGLFLILDKLFLLKLFSGFGKIPSVLITFILTIFGWVIFRSSSFDFAIDFIGKMFVPVIGMNKIAMTTEFIYTLSFASLLVFLPLTKNGNLLMEKVYSDNWSGLKLFAFVLFIFFLFFLCVGSISITGFNPFIYFRF